MDAEEPRREKERREKEEPKWTKSNTEDALPRRAKERKDNEEAI